MPPISVCVDCVLRFPFGCVFLQAVSPGRASRLQGVPGAWAPSLRRKNRLSPRWNFWFVYSVFFFCSASAKVLTAVPVLSIAPGHLMLQSAFQNFFFLLGIIFIFSSERVCWQVLQINVEASALLIHNWKFIHIWAERFFHRLKTWEAIYI